MSGRKQPTVRKLRCKRCGHTWYPRSPKRPRTCPNNRCRSAWWDVPPRKQSNDN